MNYSVAKFLSIWWWLIMLVFSSVCHSSEWQVVPAKNPNTGGNIIFRYMVLSDGVDRSGLKERVIIDWSYESATGMPLPYQQRSMNDFESAIEKNVNNSPFSLLTLVSTGEGLKEWVFYVSSGDKFIDELNILLEGHRPYPIKIYVDDDARWTTYFKAVNNLQ